jgi:multisubunit Na+/H+ antiporter MnhB subunit
MMKTENILAFGALSCAGIVAILAGAMFLMPEFGSPVLDSGQLVLKTAESGAGAANFVCSVVLDFRGYDTLGEATLLLAAVAGVCVLLGKAKTGGSRITPLSEMDGKGDEGK